MKVTISISFNLMEEETTLSSKEVLALSTEVGVEIERRTWVKDNMKKFIREERGDFETMLA